MEVTIDYSNQKEKWHIRHITDRIPYGRRSRILWYVLRATLLAWCVMGVMAYIMLSISFREPYRSLCLGLLVLVVALSIVQILSMRMYRRFKFRSAGMLTTSSRYVIEEGALAIYRNNSITRYGWADFCELEKFRDCIFAYLEPSYALCFFRRYFDDDAHFGAFYAALKAKIPASPQK